MIDTFDPDSGITWQTVTLDGNVITEYNSTSGYPYYWDIAVECQADANGVTPAHTYHNTSITLNQADMNWLGTLHKNARRTRE
jgi:hypothetical protein